MRGKPRHGSATGRGKERGGEEEEGEG